MVETHTCSDNIEAAKCVNLPGHYECECPTGYQEENRVCVDIDECKNQNFTCPPDASCKNVDGSYACQCSGS